MDLLSLLKRAEDAVILATKAVKDSKLEFSVATNKLHMETHGYYQIGKKALLRLKKDKDQKLAKYVSCLKTKEEAQKKVTSLCEDIKQHALEACVPKDSGETQSQIQ